MKPQISVVIPAYNEARFIEACLRSLRDQDFPGSFEVIVVDNASTDDTAARAASLGAQVIREPQRGVCAARQTGTLAAQGDIIISTDADTVFPRDWLSRIQAGFMKHPDAVAVAGAVEYTNAPWWGKLYAKALFGSANVRYKRSGKVSYISACNTAFRKDAWAGYNTRLTQGGDEFGLLSQLKGKGRIVFQRDTIVYTSSRRMHKGLWYNIFITIVLYYGVDYLVGRITGRSMLGSYAPIRQEAVAGRFRKMTQVAAATVIAVLGFSVATHRVSATNVLRITRSQMTSVQHTVSHHLLHR